MALAKKKKKKKTLSRPTAGALPSAGCQSLVSPQHTGRVGLVLVPAESKCTGGPHRMRPKVEADSESVDEATSSRRFLCSPLDFLLFGSKEELV